MAITVKNLHKDLAEDQLHEAKGFTTASNNTYLKKNHEGSSEWLSEYWLEPVLGVVTGASAPPTESSGDRYILTGSSFDAGWDSPSQHEIVEYNGTSWIGIAAVDGMRVVDLSNDSVYYFNTAWNQVTDANTDTTYSISAVDSGDDAIIRLTAGGSGSGTDDVTLVAGSNITLTPSGDNITIAASGGGTYTAGDGLDVAANEFSIDAKANGGLVIESTELAVDLGASAITGTLAIGDGGTGQTTAQASIDALTAAGSATIGHVLTVDSSNNAVFAAASGGGASVLNDLTDVSVLGSGDDWSVFKNASTPDGAPTTGTFTGNRNLAIGAYSQRIITSGSDNISFGDQALFSVTTGLGNIAIGDSVLYSNSSGAYNVGIGRRVLNVATGYGNIGIGQQSLTSVTSGQYNIGLGYFTTGGTQLTTGSYNINFGYQSTVNSGTSSYQFALGSGHSTLGDYLMSGDFSTTGAAKLGINLGKTAGTGLRPPNQPTATLHVKGQGTTNATTSLLIENSGGTDQVEVKDDGSVFMYNLPTSDPSVSGQLWNDGGTLKVSA